MTILSKTILLLKWMIFIIVIFATVSISMQQSHAQETDILPYSDVQTGGSYTCAIKADQTVVCWGDNSLGQATPPTSSFKQISLSGMYGCGVRTDDTLECWGEPQNNGPFGSEDYGQANPPPGKFTQVSAGELHACGILMDGTVTCWGWPDAISDVPTDSFLQISASKTHTCGIQTDYTISCWGYYSYEGDSYSDLLDAPPGKFLFVDTGTAHSCALGFDYSVACWGGDNWYGQNYLPPELYMSISLNNRLTCGLTTAGSVICRGYDGYEGGSYGIVGTFPGPFTNASTGGRHTCALRNDGTISCWGLNEYFQAPFINIQKEQVSESTQYLTYLDGVTDTDFGFLAFGGTAPYTFKTVKGSLPDGLVLNADGTITGTALNDNPTYVEIQATDALYISGTKIFWFNPELIYIPLIER
jgi:Putative Ig domain/Regulator of chromosome condensation (RCC1) repeat